MSVPYPVMVTADSIDPRFNDPYVDMDEWRDVPAPATNVFGQLVTADGPARHRYVHGGFKGTDAKFVFAFPPKEQYQGRFFQPTHQLLTSEEPLPFHIAFAVATGAYAVQTNMGGSDNPRMAEQSCSPEFDKTIRGYRVNAEAAKYSRLLAAEMYGEHRTYGYLFGGSGGSHQTVTSAEVTRGVWDGFAPYVMGNNQSIPNMFTVRINAIRVLKDKWPQIIDAIEPGGSGDPYSGLNVEERQALEEAHRSGFPPRAWFNYVPQGGGPLRRVANYVPILDPGYMDDFETKPGYLGTDPSSSVRDARIQHSTSVTSVIGGTPVRLKLASVPAGDLTGADVIITSGAAAGEDLLLGDVSGETVGFGDGTDPAVTGTIQAGDELRIDNSRFLALQTYHRHQFPPSNPDFDYPDVHDYYRDSDGTPKYPQRGVDVGAAGGEHASGHLETGYFHGKMIVVECLLDGDALPWQADWYRKATETATGGSIEDKYRLWFIDNAQHGDPQTDTQSTHVVGYAQSSLQYALRELAAWVEQGVDPPASTAYAVKDGQVLVPATAAERKGIQPVVHLSVNDGVRADVAIGETVTLTARIEVPPRAGKIVAASWDFEGLGTYPDPAELGDTTKNSVEVAAKYSFSKPGTYFPALRVASQREAIPTHPSPSPSTSAAHEWSSARTPSSPLQRSRLDIDRRDRWGRTYMTPFERFRLWFARASAAQKSGTGLAILALVAVLVWTVIPSSKPSSPVSTSAGPGASASNSAASSGGQITSGSRTNGTPAGSVGSGPLNGGSQGSSTNSSSQPASNSGTGNSGTGNSGTGNSGTGGRNTIGAACTSPPGSATGVSSNQIKVAAIVSNIGEGGANVNGALGVGTPQQQQAYYQAVIDHVNATGGIACRRVVPEYYTVNPADQSNLQATCLNIASAGVAAVIDTGGMQFVVGCFYQHHVPYFGGDSLLYVDQLKGYYPYVFTTVGAYDPLANNAVFGLAERGYFSRANGFVKLGVLTAESPPACDQSVNNEVTKDLHQIGLTSSQIVTYDFGCTSGVAAPSDIENAVLRFQSAGVTHVFTAGIGLDWTEFTTIAEQQGFKPKYGLADGGNTCCSNGSDHPDYNNMAGAIVVTSGSYGEEHTPSITPTAATQQCNAIFTAQGLPNAYQEDGAGGVVCALLAMFAAAVDNAPTLSAQSLPLGLQAVKSIGFSYPMGPNYFTGATPTAGGEYWRTDEFESSCDCFQVIDPSFHQSFQPWGAVPDWNSTNA